MLVVLAAAACSKNELKTAHASALPAATTTAASTTSMPTTTDTPIIDPSSTDVPTTAPRLTVPVTAPRATVAKSWIVVTQFSGSGAKESTTFTITGAPARVTYTASAQFSLNIDTGDPNDDTAVGSCPAAGCTGKGAVQVAAGGWYLHVIAPAATTAFSVTLEEYR